MNADSLFEASNHWYTFVTNNMCSYTSEFSILSPDVMNVQFLTTGQTNNELGSISIFVFGGTPPYTYILEGDTVESCIEGLIAGSYEVLVTDAYGCSQQVSISIQNIISTGLDESNNDLDIILTVDHIEICSSSNKLRILNLHDLQGKKVLALDLQQESLTDCKKFTCTKPSGIYIAMVKDINGNIYRKKLYKP